MSYGIGRGFPLCRAGRSIATRSISKNNLLFRAQRNPYPARYLCLKGFLAALGKTNFGGAQIPSTENLKKGQARRKKCSLHAVDDSIEFLVPGGVGTGHHHRGGLWGAASEGEENYSQSQITRQHTQRKGYGNRQKNQS